METHSETEKSKRRSCVACIQLNTPTSTRHTSIPTTQEKKGKKEFFAFFFVGYFF
jgi:hypothetical protein